MKIALKIDNVNKVLGKKYILKDISFETYKGEIFGLLGANGAGKTTLIKLIAGMSTIDSGSITICGENIQKDFENAVKNIGTIVENPEFYKYMTGYDNLKLCARVHKGVSDERICEVIKIVGLVDNINEKVGCYSLGMRQRLGLARALLHKPKVLILDEPTNGLDPIGIKDLRDVLKKITYEDKVSTIVSSHLLSEMEQICDRVGIIVKGEMIDVKTLEELMSLNENSFKSYSLQVNDLLKAEEYFNKHNIQCTNKDDFDIHIMVDYNNPNRIISKIVEDFVHMGISIYSIIPIDNRSLENVFVELNK